MLKTIQNTLISWDHILWFYFNTQWHTPVLDAIIPFLRNQWTWVPLYFFLALFIPSRFGRKGLIWCAFFIISFGVSDQLTAHLMKPFFHRIRPCNNPYLTNIIHNIVPCGGGYSFPSSHASNHFAIGVFSAMTLGKQAKWLWPVAVIWAALVSFAQVYVGVHFPLDVTCGACIGILVGICFGKIFNRNFNLAL